jgi:hypothetical protein
MDTESFEDGNESGGSLREKLEATIKERNALASELVGFKAQGLIAEKQWQHVTVEDLKGVKLTELETKGAELEAAKAALKESVLKEVLSKQGIDGEQLDEAIAQLVGKVAPADDTAATLARMRATAGIQGSAPGKIEQPGLFGASRIRAALGD